MRRLMGRKGDQGLFGEGAGSSKHGAFSSPGDLTGERVFPIRNSRGDVDMLGPAPNVKDESKFNESAEHAFPPASPDSDGPQTPRRRRKSRTMDIDDQPKVSERSQYIHSKSGPPRVLTSAVADKNRPAYRRCEDEPIRVPGAIQSFGALLGLKYNDKGQLEVRIASENCRKLLGYGPEQLFALPSFLDVLKQDMREEMIVHISHVLRDVDAIKETRLDVFQLILTFPFEPETRLWCAIHLAPSPEGMVICEFEEYSEAFYLKDIGAARVLPITPVPMMGFEVSPEELEKSTTSASKSLPVLEIARQKQKKEFSALDLFNAMTQAQKQIADCKSVQSIFEVVVGIVSELTGFHRVMLYRFDSQKNGCVEAELLNHQASTDVFRGLNYPASDIPKQARELYIINRIRLLYDREAETARLVCRNKVDFKQPLDLTHAYLRATSPVHLKYLENMGVRSTMSISIVIDSDLWGLIACHGYGDFGTRVSLPVRELCRSLGECAAVNIQRFLMLQRIEARRSPIANPSTQNPAGFITTSSADLLKLVDADFALLSIDDEARAIGRLEPYREALAIMSYLQSCRFTEIRCSQNIKADFPGLSYPPGVTLSGLLIIPLNVGEGNDLLVFFRKGQLQEVKWAGNPHETKYKPDSHTLEPRTSFLQWVETTAGTSKEWTSDQLDTAWILALLYGRFIDIWRQKGSANQRSQMSLIRASSREVRTPLYEIVNCLEMALENNVDDNTRAIVDRAQQASKSLVSVIDNLLKLTETEDGTADPVDETFNLKLTASKALQALQKEAKRKTLDLTVSVHEKLPAMVKGNSHRFKQVIVYFTSNAFKQSRSVKVDLNLIRTKDGTSTIELQVQDSGPGMSEEELDDIFQEFQQAQDDESWPFPTKEPTWNQNETDGGMSPDIAVIARYVRNVNGQIQVKSELGRGTIFSVELAFEHSLSSDTAKPRKLRNLLASLGSPKGLSPPPSMRPPPRPILNEAQRKAETTAHAEGSSSPSTVAQSPDKSLSPRPGLFDHPLSPYNATSETTSPSPDMDNEDQAFPVNLKVLVAEDDPISLRMLDERLSQWGHTVEVACDGQECLDRFASNTSNFDVILMDLKMPAVDGILSTRMIRFSEQESKDRQNSDAGDPQYSEHRVPIIALSASLYEESRLDYIQNGFDGWILKPINFRRLDLILRGVKNAKSKRDCLYVPGQWEKGGWFLP